MTNPKVEQALCASCGKPTPSYYSDAVLCGECRRKLSLEPQSYGGPDEHKPPPSPVDRHK